MVLLCDDIANRNKITEGHIEDGGGGKDVRLREGPMAEAEENSEENREYPAEESRRGLLVGRSRLISLWMEATCEDDMAQDGTMAAICLLMFRRHTGVTKPRGGIFETAGTTGRGHLGRTGRFREDEDGTRRKLTDAEKGKYKTQRERMRLALKKVADAKKVSEPDATEDHS